MFLLIVDFEEAAFIFFLLKNALVLINLTWQIITLSASLGL